MARRVGEARPEDVKRKLALAQLRETAAHLGGAIEERQREIRILGTARAAVLANIRAFQATDPKDSGERG